jgi:hypothetical protein
MTTYGAGVTNFLLINALIPPHPYPLPSGRGNFTALNY